MTLVLRLMPMHSFLTGRKLAEASGLFYFLP